MGKVKKKNKDFSKTVLAYDNIRIGSTFTVPDRLDCVC